MNLHDPHCGIVILENVTEEPYPALILNEKSAGGDARPYLDAVQVERLRARIGQRKLGFEIYDRDGRYGLRLTDTGQELAFPSTVDDAGVVHFEMPGWSWEEIPDANS